MKSGISSCKAMALKKDLTRFWPVWAGYCLCLIFLHILQSTDQVDYWYAANMAECISIMGFVNFVYALASAQMLFGDLFTPRMCYGLHSLPLKREHWFHVHVTAGLLFSLVPTTLMGLFSEARILQTSAVINGWQIPLLWWAGCNLQYLFFFGLAVFCVMSVGSRFAMLVVYGILNFFSMLTYLLVDQLYTPLLPGVVTQSAPFELLCPMWQILSTRFVDCDRVETGKTFLNEGGIEEREYVGTFTIPYESWIYLAVLAALGILLLLAARQMYRKRHLECAGDFLAQRWLEPVFQIVFTILCAAGFHALFYIFFGSYDSAAIIIALGLLTGWFGGRMLLERTTRVFRLKNFAGLVLMILAIAGSLWLTSLDPMNIAGWVPEKEEPTQISLGLSSRSDFTTDDPQEMADLLRIHELALEQDVTLHPDYDDLYPSIHTQTENATRITLTYRLPNSWISQREYEVRAEGELEALIRKYCSRLDVVAAHTDADDADDLRRLMQGTEQIVVSGHVLHQKYMTEEFFTALADAIAADCQAGNLVQSSVFHSGTIVEGPTFDTSVHSLYLDIHGLGFFTYFHVYADCENILSLMETTNVMDAIRQEQEFYYSN